MPPASGDATTSSASAGALSLLTVRLVYTDVEPDYCDEACAAEGMFGSVSAVGGAKMGSVDGLLRDSSYGAVSFDESLSVVVSVEMQRAVMQEADGCHPEEAREEADRLLRIRGIEPLEYSLREYFVPRQFGSCLWGGHAPRFGCLALPSPIDCYIFVRDPHPVTRAHELGHTLGLHHAWTREGGEFGDESSVMGGSRHWKGFNAPNRFQLGWLPLQSIAEVGVPAPDDGAAEAARIHVIRSLHLPPNSCCAASSALRLRGNVPELWVSYRERAGYDEDLPEQLGFRVMVHALRQDDGGLYHGTTLLAVLDHNESYLGENHAIHVCSRRRCAPESASGGGAAVLAVAEGAMSAQSAVSACLGLDSDALYALYAPDSDTAGASLAEEGAGSMVPLRSMLGGTLGGAVLFAVAAGLTGVVLWGRCRAWPACRRRCRRHARPPGPATRN